MSNIWLVRHSETLPCDGDNPRLLRMGLLAEELHKRGHEITWWTSTLLYNNKIDRFEEDKVLRIRDRYTIRLIHSIGYKKNLSLRRLRHYAFEKKRFLELAEKLTPPDLIVVSMPAIEWAYAAVRYAKEHDVPVFVDIRDTFPDMYLDYFNQALRPVASLAIYPYRKQLSWTLAKATGIFASSDQYLDWGLKYAKRARISSDQVYHISYPDIANGFTSDDLRKWTDLGLTESDFICCFFGQFGHTVDIDTVVEAGKRFDPEGRVKFVVCGVGEKLQGYVADTKDYPNILFPGWVNKSEIAALCSISSAGLMAYKPGKNYEMSMPNKFGEYLALSQAILLQPNGIMVEYIQNHNCGLSYSNAEELERCISRLISNEGLLSTMKENSRALYLSEFCAEVVYSKEADFLEASVLADNGGDYEI